MDSKDLANVIKRAATDAVNASKPAEIKFGSVISASPLKIQTDQKIVLGTAQLVLCRSVTNHTETMVVDGQTLTVTVNGGLSSGEKVILARVIGGQKYIVIDRVG